ncbi:MAG: L-threonylcarbamoyladenylate synthase [Thermoanaerobaculia bacterium]|jgi:L-threonylcarbamoyladenylate synthase
MTAAIRWHFVGEPDGRTIEEIAAVLTASGVVILPTDTLYGFHASARDRAAIARIQECKDREGNKPLLVLCSSLEQTLELGVVVDDATRATLDAIWPAPLTAILPLREPIAASCGTSTLGVRVPASSWLRSLAAIAGPIASTSVNYAGEPATTSVDALPDEIVNRVDGVADAGPLDGQPSTIVSFCIEPPAVIRQGAFDFTQELWKNARKTL